MTAKAMITASVPSVNTSKRRGVIPHVSLKLYPAPSAFSITSGNAATNDASTMKAVQMPPAIHTPAVPPGTRYGRGTSGCEYLSLIAQRTSPGRGERRVVAVDGKTLRGSAHGGQPAVHLLAALDHAHGAVLGQVDVGAKTSEIALFTALLDRVDIGDAVVTADAMHTQRGHACACRKPVPPG
jgi:hypothetical protein